MLHDDTALLESYIMMLGILWMPLMIVASRISG